MSDQDFDSSSYFAPKIDFNISLTEGITESLAKYILKYDTSSQSYSSLSIGDEDDDDDDENIKSIEEKIFIPGLKTDQVDVDNIISKDHNDQQPHTWQQLVLAWSGMVGGVIGFSSVGPVFKYLEDNGISPSLTASWRCQCMAILLLPPAVLESRYQPIEWFARKDDLRFPVWVYVVIAGLAWAANLLLWTISLQFVTVVKASLYTSIHPLILCFSLWYGGEVVSGLEWAGVLVAIAGIFVSASSALLSQDADDASSNS